MGIIRGMAGHTEETWTPFILFLDVIRNSNENRRLAPREITQRATVLGQPLAKRSKVRAL